MNQFQSGCKDCEYSVDFLAARAMRSLFFGPFVVLSGTQEGRVTLGPKYEVTVHLAPDPLRTPHVAEAPSELHKPHLSSISHSLLSFLFCLTDPLSPPPHRGQDDLLAAPSKTNRSQPEFSRLRNTTDKQASFWNMVVFLLFFFFSSPFPPWLGYSCGARTTFTGHGGSEHKAFLHHVSFFFFFFVPLSRSLCPPCLTSSPCSPACQGLRSDGLCTDGLKELEFEQAIISLNDNNQGTQYGMQFFFILHPISARQLGISSEKTYRRWVPDAADALCPLCVRGGHSVSWPHR